MVNRASLLVAATCAVACYSPLLQSPGYYCHADDVPACPGAQLCVNGRCVNGLDGSTPPDLAMPRDLGGGPTDGGSGGGCDAGTSCPAATSLGSVNADTGGMQSTMGNSAQWLSIQAVENNNGLTGQRMRLSVTLTSPAGSNFDLYVYRNGGGATPECSAVSGSSTSTSAIDTVSIDWGETDGSIPNGSSDNALVTIEVRAVSATCSASQRWTLDVKGGP